MNRNYVKCDANDVYEFAPDVVQDENGLHTRPDDKVYAHSGYVPFVDEHPVTDAEHYAVGTEYADLVDGVRRRRYEIRETIPAPKVYSKLKLYAALAQANLWDAFKSWLETQEVNGLNAYTAFTLAQDLTSDNKLFSQYFVAAKTALGVDDVTVAEILQAAEV